MVFLQNVPLKQSIDLSHQKKRNCWAFLGAIETQDWSSLVDLFGGDISWWSWGIISLWWFNLFLRTSPMPGWSSMLYRSHHHPLPIYSWFVHVEADSSIDSLILRVSHMFLWFTDDLQLIRHISSCFFHTATTVIDCPICRRNSRPLSPPIWAVSRLQDCQEKILGIEPIQHEVYHMVIYG